LALVGLVVVAVILLTPQCAVEHQALLFDMEQYSESPEKGICHAIQERINAYNSECGGDVVVWDCG
jgi:hypothetical protein